MHSIRFIAISLLVMLSSVYKAEESITFYTHSVNQAVVKNKQGEMVGVPGGGRRSVDVEIVRWILKDLNMPNTIETVPFKRALRMVQTEDNNAVFNILRTIDRNKTMQWVGPIQYHRSYFYEAIERPTNIKTVAAAAEVKSVCVLSGNVHHTMLSKMGFDNLVLAGTYRQCVELLIRGRVALMPAGSHPVFLNDPEIEGKVTRTPVMINQNDGYMGLSLNINPEIVQQLQASLDKLKSIDDYKRIIKTFSEENGEDMRAYSTDHKSRGQKHD